MAGSSPLARGLLDAMPSLRWATGIIPARAGFTPGGSRGGGRLGDHPRSRGVYRRTIRVASHHPGSSPLARGLPVCRMVVTVRVRIIPARAGFTPSPGARGAGRRDHPRSRGVYDAGGTDNDALDGSSPLARGLRVRGSSGSPPKRIIPARAGFTESWSPHSQASADHPRSRGVYPSASAASRAARGSSPLARGLPVTDAWPQITIGIIPARAGFTEQFHRVG